MDSDFALLCLQAEWGADEAIGADPVDRLRPAEPRPQRAPPVAPVPAIATGRPVERAQEAAAGAATLDALRAAVAGFDGCGLRDTASNLVFAEGDANAAVLIVGEPPGREEDRSGHPFAGAEGALLDQMLGSIGLTRAGLMLVPLLPWRPPGGRPPSPAEIAVCLPFLHRVISLVQPSLLVLFGGTAAGALLGQTQIRRRAPAAWAEINISGMTRALPSLALPSLGEMGKNPPLRRVAWAGLRLLRRSLDDMQT